MPTIGSFWDILTLCGLRTHFMCIILTRKPNKFTTKFCYVTYITIMSNHQVIIRRLAGDGLKEILDKVLERTLDKWTPFQNLFKAQIYKDIISVGILPDTQSKMLLLLAIPKKKIWPFRKKKYKICQKLPLLGLKIKILAWTNVSLTLWQHFVQVSVLILSQ